jgi:outer membrane lipoprotein SlyB
MAQVHFFGAYMPTTAQDTSRTSGSIGAVPRSVWVAGGLLCVVTAGLAGALIMRAVQPPSPAVGVASAAVEVPNADAPAPEAIESAASVKSDRRARAATGSATPAQGTGNASVGGSSAALCVSCGVVESVNQVQHKGQGTGVGAVAGGLLGGVVGHQLGHGNGNTAMTVLGAIGGGLAGNEVEKRARADTHFAVHVRMDDGSVRVYERPQPLAVGTRVVADGATLRVSRDPAIDGEPHTVRTSAAPGNRT